MHINSHILVPKLTLTVMRATTLLLQCVGGRRGGSDKAEEDVEMEGTIAAVAVGSDSSWY